MANDEDRTAEMPRPPAALPITCAPVKLGLKFGPCLLLAPGAANYPNFTPWIFGGWDGEVWFDIDGPVIQPTHWAPTPEVPI